MSNGSANPSKYYEDFEEGFCFEYTVPGLTSDQIIAFATQYDPQRFHLDESEASKTHFGGLIASGFQSAVLCFKPFCVSVLNNAHAVGAPGIDVLQWKRPWYPGETIEVSVTLSDKRLSSKRNDRGYLTFKLKAFVKGELSLVMEWVNIVLTRNGS